MSKTKPQPYEANKRLRRLVSAVQNVANESEQRRQWYRDLWERYDALGQEKELLVNTMQEALFNCETCRESTDVRSRCARCQTFAKVIHEVNQPEEAEA